MPNELLIIYLIDGIDGNDYSRLDDYIDCINNVLDQDFGYAINLCISSCLNSDRVIGIIQDHFFDIADICRIQENLPLSVRFNKAVQECVKKYGNFARYAYMTNIDDIRTFNNDIFSSFNNTVLFDDIEVDYEKIKGEFWHKI